MVARPNRTFYNIRSLFLYTYLNSVKNEVPVFAPVCYNFQLQEIPMMAAVEYNKSETEKEGYNVDTIYRQELFKFGDKEIDYQYTLTKNRRNDILNDINKKLVEYSSNGGNKEHVEVITDEVTRIKKNIDIIHDSHMSNSKKREAYLGFDKELIEVLSLITRLNNINKTIMSHE